MLTVAALALISCGSSNANYGRVLTSISVTPSTADAQTFPGGQVTYTATGTFNQPPITGPVSAGAPYDGAFGVATLNTTAIATIVTTGSGTATVQCVSGQSGTVQVFITANANNGSSETVSGSASITCP